MNDWQEMVLSAFLLTLVLARSFNEWVYMFFGGTSLLMLACLIAQHFLLK